MGRMGGTGGIGWMGGGMALRRECSRRARWMAIPPFPIPPVLPLPPVPPCLGLPCAGESPLERRPVAGFADGADGSAMRLDDGLHEAEAEAETTLGAAPVAAEEPFPEARELVRRNARPGVADANRGGV